MKEPDCMTPDGGAPCAAYRQLQDETERLRARIQEALTAGMETILACDVCAKRPAVRKIQVCGLDTLVCERCAG